MLPRGRPVAPGAVAARGRWQRSPPTTP